MRQPALVLAVSALLFSLFLPQTLFAQSSATPSPFPPVRQEKAVAAVQAAIAAFGSAATAQTVEAQVLVQSPGPNGTLTNTVTWEMSGAEFRIAASVGNSSSIIVTGYGNPAATLDGQTHPVPKHVIEAMFIPAFAGATLAREFQNANYSLQYLGPQTVNGTPCTAVKTELPTAAPNPRLTDQIWYFSNATNLPIRVIYRSPADQTPLVSRPETVDLLDFTSVSGGMYPFKMVDSFSGQQMTTMTLQSVSPNASIPSTDFDAPSGGAR